MPMYYDTETEQIEHQHELEKYELLTKQKELERRHQENMLKLKIELAGKNRRGVGRIEAVQRILLAIVKMPMMPLAFCIIGIQLIRDREVPEFVQAYISV